MTHSRPDWLLLIRRWVFGGSIGYSLPFLVGARTIREGGTVATVDDARMLLDEMFNPQGMREILQLTWCPNLDVPVFGLNREQIPGIAIPSKHTGKPSIFVRADIVAKWGGSAEQLMEHLLEHAQGPIVSGHFSRSWSQTWQPFPAEERDRINNILANA